ncbi:response regulator [Haliangium sp. UPWRP_2]|uniref:response regulator transcription factor n=1 Tax=Haliangium sp. UPWRP_2 TaxID=1931276 RepID=UPI001304B605|nr:response regulator [Haliangium sp. UPWRP_2]
MSARILIVDDDPAACHTLEALLSPCGFLCSSVDAGGSALQHLETHPTDLVVADAMMPVLDGFELCRRIKAHPAWRYIPLVIVTALDDEASMVRGLEAGADEFLFKPINKAVLRTRVRVLLRIRQQYQELMQRLSPSSIEGLVRRRADELSAELHLSAREREVLDLLLIGRTNEEIGIVLNISTRTAKFHLGNLLQKLGVDSRHELIRLFL